MSQLSSVWSATTTATRYPQLSSDRFVDVAVIGGGITGLTTSLLLAKQGVSVALIEADRVGGGTTAGTTGKVTSQHALTYHSLIQNHGERKARLYAQANQAAIETVARLAGETSADCQLERAPAYLYSLAESDRSDIEAEYDAAARLGLPATLTNETDLPFAVTVALRFDNQIHFHPTRYTAAIARGVIDAGGSIFERTRATGVHQRGGRGVVTTEHGEVHADHVVVATLLPFINDGGYFARTNPARSYGVAARLGGDAPSGMHISAGSESRSTRPWIIDGERRGLIVVGEGHRTGEGDSSPERWGELERWASRHFDVVGFDYRWSAQDYITTDQVPYVGRFPFMERTYVACGFKKWGLTNGTVAAEIITDMISGRDNPWMEAFDSTRIGGARTAANVVAANIHVGRRLVIDRVGRLTAGPVEGLEPGEGGIVRDKGRAVGAYRDPAGTIHAVSINCTHLGCTLKWNSAERSWDCPCHGSRFDIEGAVLNSPAVRPLKQIQVSPVD